MRPRPSTNHRLLRIVALFATCSKVTARLGNERTGHECFTASLVVEVAEPPPHQPALSRWAVIRVDECPELDCRVVVVMTGLERARPIFSEGGPGRRRFRPPSGLEHGNTHFRRGSTPAADRAGRSRTRLGLILRASTRAGMLVP